LERGADVNEARKSDVVTALIFAALNGHTETVSELLARGADTEARASDGSTALMRAAKNGHTEIVLTLLPPDRIAREIDANTALMFAAGYGHIETVDELLNQGADVNAKTSDGYTALMRAAKNGHTEIVLDLLSRDNLDWEIALDQFGLLLALPNSNKEVSFLLAVIIHDEELRNSIIRKFNQENTDNPINQENNDILGAGIKAYENLKDLKSWHVRYLTDSGFAEDEVEISANQRFFYLLNHQDARKEALARNDIVEDLVSSGSESLFGNLEGSKEGKEEFLEAASKLGPEDLHRLKSEIIDSSSKALNDGNPTLEALSLVAALSKNSEIPATTMHRDSAAATIAKPIVTPPRQNDGFCVIS